MAYFEYKGRKVYYEVQGEGDVLLFLHGNTGSSKMFDSIMGLYRDQFKVVTIDFLGHGQSDRLDEFPVHLWSEEALQTIALMEHLSLEKVNLIGTSGGAWVAINTALTRPDLINKVVADSFDGRTLGIGFAEALFLERQSAKNNDMAIGFYRYCHGEDWERIVDQDTDSLLKMAQTRTMMFDKEISELRNPLLLTASATDDMIRVDVAQEYASMIGLIPKGKMHVFSSGHHPAILSNDCAFFELVKAFINA